MADYLQKKTNVRCLFDKVNAIFSYQLLAIRNQLFPRQFLKEFSTCYLYYDVSDLSCQNNIVFYQSFEKFNF
jgi:hypothetical protein